jgi:hypothetical protein
MRCLLVVVGRGRRCGVASLLRSLGASDGCFGSVLEKVTNSFELVLVCLPPFFRAIATWVCHIRVIAKRAIEQDRRRDPQNVLLSGIGAQIGRPCLAPPMAVGTSPAAPCWQGPGVQSVPAGNEFCV